MISPPFREMYRNGIYKKSLETLYQNEGVRVQGSGFRVQGSGFKVQGSRSALGTYRPLIVNESFARIRSEE